MTKRYESARMKRRRERDRLRKARRYWEDEEYREKKILEAKRRYYSRRPARRAVDPISVSLQDGSEILLIPAGQAAAILGTTRRALSALERKGALPRLYCRDKNGWRWFPLDVIRRLVPVFAEQRSRREPARIFRARVTEVIEDIAMILAGGSREQADDEGRRPVHEDGAEDLEAQ